MKKGGILLICSFLFAFCLVPGAYSYVMENTWEEIDQATNDVQAAQPLPAGVLVPAGGTTGQVLIKSSDTDGDTGWGDQSGGGTGTLKWYDHKDVASPAADTTYEWLRPFENWKIAAVVGRVSDGAATIDLQLCELDLTGCDSILSAPLDLTTTEQAFALSFDGITADKKLVMVTSGTPSAGNVMLDIHGTYETGTPPSSGRVYLVNLDFETAVTWDDTLGTEACPPANVGEYCTQSDLHAVEGNYSARLYGSRDDVHLATDIGKAVSEYYLDYWQLLDSGTGSSYVLLSEADLADYSLSFYTFSNALQLYQNDGPTLNTGINLTDYAGNWVHMRIYVKKDTNGSDGIVRFWFSTTETNFDGKAPTQEWLNTQTSSTIPTRVTLRGPAASYKINYDNVQLWEPDGNE